MGAQVNDRNPPLNFCLLRLSLLIEGFDCGLPWAIKTLWKSKGWLVLLLLVCHITVSVLWIPCSLAIFSWFSLRALCFHSESSQLGFFLKFRVLHFFLIQISGVQYYVFVLNWKHQTYGVVKQLFWSCTCSGFLSVSFSSRETSSFGFRKRGNASTLQASILLQAEVLQGWRY